MLPEVNSAEQIPFAMVQEVGVVIKETDGQTHVGFLYCLDEKGPRITHLAWHRVMVTALPDPSYSWVQCRLDETNRLLVAVAIQQIADFNERSSIPYSPTYRGSYFDGGVYSQQTVGEGLTCATFVMAVFDGLGLDLFNRETWRHRTEDAAWQRHIISQLEASPCAAPDIAAHVTAIKAHPMQMRFRPEEVTAAVGCSETPLAFPEAAMGGRHVLAQLSSAPPNEQYGCDV